MNKKATIYTNTEKEQNKLKKKIEKYIKMKEKNRKEINNNSQSEIIK